MCVHVAMVTGESAHTSTTVYRGPVLCHHGGGWQAARYLPTAHHTDTQQPAVLEELVLEEIECHLRV